MLSSYFVEIQYSMVAGGTGQVACVVIKRTGDSFLQTNVELTAAGVYTATLQYVQNGVRSTLLTETLGGATIANGFLRLSYNATTFVASMRVIPSGGPIVSKTSTLTELQSAALGQNSAIGLSYQATPQPVNAIKTVVGGSI